MEINPTNIFVENQNHLLLGHYRLSKLLSENLSLKEERICYSAPEVTKEEIYGYESDIYSLGASLYFAATKKNYLADQDSDKMKDYSR